MVTKPLSFKEWLKDWYAIDYDRWVPEITDETNKIWHDGYNIYLNDWEENKNGKGND